MQINKPGFSLMEMMVVLLITAIIAAASAPAVSKKMQKATAGTVCPWNRTNTGIAYEFNPAATSTVSISADSDESGLSPKLFIRSDNSPQIILGNGGNNLPIRYTGTSISMGNQTVGNNSVLLGVGATAGANSVATGFGAAASANAVAIGENSNAGDNAVMFNKGTAAANAIIIKPGSVNAINNITIADRDSITIGDSIRTNANEIKIGLFDSGYRGSSEIGGIQNVTKSDRRLKNVGTVFTGGLEQIRQLVVYNYTFKDDKNRTPRVGVMAQDLQKIFPNAVFKTGDGYLNIRQEDMFYSMINAIKELDNKVTLALQKQDKVDELEKKLDNLEKRAKKL